MTDPRQPAYDAVFAYIRQQPRDFLPVTVFGRNAMIWRAVHAALDAMGVPGLEGEPAPAATEATERPTLRERHRAQWLALTDAEQTARIAALDEDDEPEQPERTTGNNPATWTPPPPGDRREQLPDHLLALLDIPPYTSTACETAELLAAAITRHPEHADELRQWEQRQRQRCRINNKYTGVNCQHIEAEDALTPAEEAPTAPEPGIGCLTVTTERTPSQLPGLRDQLADATVPLLLDTLPKVIARARGYEVADAVLTLLYREWPWLRAEAEDAAPQPGS